MPQVRSDRLWSLRSRRADIGMWILRQCASSYVCLKSTDLWCRYDYRNEVEVGQGIKVKYYYAERRRVY